MSIVSPLQLLRDRSGASAGTQRRSMRAALPLFLGPRRFRRRKSNRKRRERRGCDAEDEKADRHMAQGH